MITKQIWENHVIYNAFREGFDFFLAVLVSLITIPLDILLLPVEILSIVIQKFIEGK